MFTPSDGNFHDVQSQSRGLYSKGSVGWVLEVVESSMRAPKDYVEEGERK